MTSAIVRQMLAAEVLKLRRNRALVVLSLLLSVGLLVIFFGYNAIQHASNPAQYAPAGGLNQFTRAVRVLGLFFGSLAAILVGTEAGTADLASGVFRDLVATGRSRLALFFVRAPAAIAVTVICTGAGFLLTLVCTFLFSGGLATPTISQILEAAGWIILANAILAALAVGVGSISGSRSVTLTAVIGWQAIVTQLLLNITSLGSARDLLLTAALRQANPLEPPDFAMATGIAVLVLLGWATIPAAIGAWRTRTQDA
jgi:ABC-type transport system involved in multi-copper enzyme maturation permease subunit